jgi:hypothetical protein
MVSYIRNPLTGRACRKGTSTYKTLVRSGIIDKEGNDIRALKAEKEETSEPEEAEEAEEVVALKTAIKSVKKPRRKRRAPVEAPPVQMVDHGFTEKELIDFLEENKARFEGTGDDQLIARFNEVFNELYESDEE